MQTIAAMALQAPINPTPPASQSLLQWADYWYAFSWQCVLFAGAVTALGACVMVAFLMLQWRAAGIREAQTVWLATNVEAQTAQARKDTADALERLATLDIEAARLHRKNLSLEELVQPRQLTSAQAQDVSQALASYSGHAVTLWSYGLDLEGSALAEQIRESLIAAHVVVVNNIGQLSAPARPRVGVQIAGADKRLVDALYDGFHAIGGLDAGVVELAGADAADAVPAEIFVGMKPLTRQNDAIGAKPVARQNDAVGVKPLAQQNHAIDHAALALSRP
jgi:hypothetical protein